MITTRYIVKEGSKLWDGKSATQPDASFDESSRYYEGFRLLVKDGTLWDCLDSSVGAAVWIEDDSKDERIDMVIRQLSELIPEYCNTVDELSQSTLVLSGVSFASGGVMTLPIGDAPGFFVGDTLNINGSLRNDGIYDIIDITGGVITVSGEFGLLGTDESRIRFDALLYENGISFIAGNMATYDVYERDSNGLSSEGIGSYSYSKETVDIVGMQYPASIVSGIMSFKSPRVM